MGRTYGQGQNAGVDELYGEKQKATQVISETALLSLSSASKGFGIKVVNC
jgi:hypothetical protein